MLVPLEPFVHYQVNNGALSFFIRIRVYMCSGMRRTRAEDAYACMYACACAKDRRVRATVAPCELRDACQQVVVEARTVIAEKEI